MNRSYASARTWRIRGLALAALAAVFLLAPAQHAWAQG